jgi:hypothetical protein
MTTTTTIGAGCNAFYMHCMDKTLHLRGEGGGWGR